jgi:outer membrane protein OmpA-like peptidoglycan-associated protein
MGLKIFVEANDDNAVTSWEIAINDSNKNPVFNEKKQGTLPDKYIWDGKTNIAKVTAPEGSYTATLTVHTVNGVTTIVESKPFVIDLTPPDITVTRNKEIFSPDGDGVEDTITFSFPKSYDKTGIKKWKLVITNPMTKKEFISFEGEGAPTKEIIWNGLGAKGQLVESATEYPIKIIAEDLVGNISEKVLTPVSVDILIMKLDDGRYKIKISNIGFQAESAQMTPGKGNEEILNLLVKALKKFPDYKILIEGYANKYREGLNEKQAQKLSDQRSIVISSKLVALGIAKDRISVIGKGFENPIIPLRPKMTKEEIEEMEINRRVEFYLSK